MNKKLILYLFLLSTYRTFFPMESRENSSQKQPRQHPPSLSVIFPFHQAIKNRNIMKIYQILQDNPCAIKTQNSNGDTPLHIALTRTKKVPLYKLIKLLLVKKANPDIPNNQGETCWHYAARLNNPKYLKLISRYSTNCTSLTKDGILPHDIVKIQNKKEHLKILCSVSPKKLWWQKTTGKKIKKAFSKKPNEAEIYKKLKNDHWF